MGKRVISSLVWLTAAAWMTGCGGAQEGGGGGGLVVDREAGGGGSGISLPEAEITSSFDEEGMRALTPAASEYLPDTKEVWFVGTLEGLPPGAEIEVRWSKTTSERDLYISRDSGSGTHRFFSHFKAPTGEAFEEGQYWARVYVNGEQVGEAGFRAADRRSGGVSRVKELAVSLQVEAGTNVAVSPSSSLPMGIKKVYASFYVGGVEPGNTIRVRWYLEDGLVDEQDIESEGEKRYATFYEQKKGLARGDYAVEVEAEQGFSRRTFFVGDTSGGPVIEEASLGTAAGKGGMPKKAMTRFKQKSGTIRCGIRFITAPKGAEVEVKWISGVDGGEDVLETTASTVKSGGPSTVGMTWKPGTLKPGPYKAVIAVDGSNLMEIPFTVE